MKNSLPILVPITLIFCVLRCYIATDALVVMAAINGIALFFTLYIVIYNACEEIEIEIDKTQMTPHDKKIRKKTIKKNLWLITTIAFLLSGLIYMKFHNEVSNDILSIISLGIAVADKDLSNLIVYLCKIK